MIRRALGTLLLVLLITPLPALCQACVMGTCPDQMVVEEHDHTGMEPGRMEHSGMEQGAPIPDCHTMAEMEPPEPEPTPEPCASTTVQASVPSCCETMEAATPVPAVTARSLVAPASLTVVLSEAISMARVSPTFEPTPKASPPLRLPPLYTLHSSLLI